MQLNPNLSCFPEERSIEHYKDVRENRKNGTNKYTKAYTAGIGYFASYGGRYFDGGYGRDAKGKRNIYAERLSYARNQAPLLKDIEFDVCDYTKYSDYKNYVFYLDPPYKGTKSYKNIQDFDYVKFYDFCRN